jgi:NadR type nicotinamide-nucleotide adenylyltransferase
MLKIAILGPESTGKTMLAGQLAEHFNAPWVPEYARQYIEKLTVPYTYVDVCNIALKQIEEEQAIYNGTSTVDYVFFDTELIITKVWFDYRFGSTPDFLTEHLNSGFFDLYLLCSPDLPWEPDPVREHGEDREFFFNWYKREIDKIGKPCFVITGFGEQRFQNALNGLKMLPLIPRT